MRNEGPTIAEDVRISFDPPLQGAGLSRGLDSMQQRLSNGLPSIPPGREMAWNFAVGHLLYADDSQVPRQYTVSINGRGPYGELSNVTYVLDLDDLRDTADPRYGSLADVAKAIRALGGPKR